MRSLQNISDCEFMGIIPKENLGILAQITFLKKLPIVRVIRLSMKCLIVVSPSSTFDTAKKGESPNSSNIDSSLRTILII